MANQRGGFFRSMIIGRLLGGIAPRETIKFSRESEVQIPRWQTWELVLNVNVMIAVAIFLICWLLEWKANGDMYYVIRHLAPWKRIIRLWLLFATWPGILIAYFISARRQAKELWSRNWEQWDAIDRSMKYLNQDEQDMRSAPANAPAEIPIALMENWTDENARDLWEEDQAK